MNTENINYFTRLIYDNLVHIDNNANVLKGKQIEPIKRLLLKIVNSAK